MKKKKKGKLTRLKFKYPARLVGNYNPGDAQIALGLLLLSIQSEVKSDIDATTPLYTKALHSKMVAGITGDILDKDYDNPKTLVKKIARVIKKKAKIASVELSVNDAYQNLNRGELLGAEASKQATIKRWVTQFDSKTRSWHDTMDHQERDLKDRFTVPYPGGVDYLKAPKIPPISNANFINCRCYVQYAIIE